MAKIRFRNIRLGAAKLAMIDACNEIIADYRAQRLRLTLRQLYYQLVTKNLITNEEKSYKGLGATVSDGRLAGLIDWNAIEDRVRRPRNASEWESIPDLVESALDAFRLPRWKGQDYYAELWVEKDALAGVLEPLAFDHHVTLMVNRGYSSQSAMFEAAQRFIDRCEVTAHEEGIGEYAYPEGRGDDDDEAPREVELARRPVLFYLGDHDPSGEDMVRDVRERLAMFGIDVDVQKIALTTEQVRRYRPPPNPAKMTDSRAAAYVAKHGRSSWEVDALPPEVLAQIVTDAFDGVLDREKMAEVIALEEKGKAALRKAAERIVL